MSESGSNKNEPPEIANSGTDSAEKKKGRWRKFCEKHPRWSTFFRRAFKAWLLCLLLGFFMSFPRARGVTFYPLLSIFNSPYLSVSGCNIFTSTEQPSFALDATFADRYVIRVYKRRHIVSTPGQTSEIQLASISPKLPENIRSVYDSGASSYRVTLVDNWLNQESELLKEQSGIFVPRDGTAAGLTTKFDPLPPGDYVFSADAINDFRKIHHRILIPFRVSDLGVVMKRDLEKIAVRAVNLLTHKPISNAVVSMFWQDNNKLQSKITSATGLDGTAIIKRTKDYSDNDWQQVVVDVTDEKQHAYVEKESTSTGSNEYWNRQWNYTDPTNRFRTCFSTDKPIYRLGDTVQFKGFVRKLDSDGLVNQGNCEIEATIRDSNYKEVSKPTLVTNEFGCFEGHLAISSTAHTGQYQIELKYPNGSQESFTFYVDQYRRPEYFVTVTPDKGYERIVCGNKLKMRVHAQYYFGAPVTDAAITYDESCNADTSLKTAFSMAHDQTSFFDSWGSPEGYGYYGSSPDSSRGTAITDKNGDAMIEINTTMPKVQKEHEYNYDFADRLYNFSVTVTDKSRKTETASGSTTAVRGDYAVVVTPVSQVLAAGEKIQIDLKTLRYDGKPAANRNVKLKLCTWEKKDLLSDVYVEKQVETESVSTSADGTAKFEFSSKKQLPTDNYYLVAESKDDAGRIVGDSARIWIFGDRNSKLSSESQLKQTQIVFDKTSYKPGETAKVMVSAPYAPQADRTAIISIEGSKLHDFKIVQMPTAFTKIDVPVKNEYCPNVHVVVTMIGEDHNPFLTSQVLRVSPEAHFLNVKFDTNKKVYSPGEEVDCTIKAQLQNGTPAKKTQLALSFVDEGIYSIAEKSGMWSLPDIYHSIFAEIPNWVDTRFSFDKKIIATCQQSPVFDGAGFYPLLIPLYIAGGGPRILNALGPVQYEMMSRQGRAASAPMLKGATNGTIGPQNAGYAIEGADSLSSLARLPKPKTAGLNSGVPMKVRKNFKDLAFWAPSVTTDENGIAKLKFKLPDDLTTWRAITNMIDTNIDVGSATTDILSSQDFIARLSLPRFYTQGDKAVITGIVHNYSDRDQTVHLTLTPSKQLTVKSPLVTQVMIPAGGMKQLTWPVEATASGSAKVALKAVGQTAGDALEQMLPVRSLCYRAFFANGGIIKTNDGKVAFPLVVPPQADTGTGSFELSLSSSEIGPVLGNFSSLIDYPYGCTEQTLSRLIPSVVAMRLHKELGVDLPVEEQEKFKKVYDIAMPKLIEYQHPDGGWGWWKDDSSNVFLTAQVLEGLHWLDKTNCPISGIRLNEALSRLHTDMSKLPAAPWEREASVDHAKAMYVLSIYDMPAPPTMKNWQMLMLRQLTPEALSYLTMAYKNWGDMATAQIFYKRLLELKNSSNEYIEWDHTQALIAKLAGEHAWDYTYRYTGVETTALALRAVLAMEPKNDALIEPICHWLILQKDENGWNNTKCTAQVFLSLLERELAMRTDRTTHIKARIMDGNKLMSLLSFDKAVEANGERIVKIGLANHPAQVSLQKNGPGYLFYNSLLQYDRLLKPGENVIAKSMPADLKITTTLFKLTPYDAHKHPLSRKDAETTVPSFYVRDPITDTPIKTGDLIQMQVIVDSPISLPYVMLQAPIPSGGEFAEAHYPIIDREQLKPDWKPADNYYPQWWWTHEDKLDDRMVFFASEMKPGRQVFETLLRMEMPGDFGVNPADLQAMYSRRVRAYSKVSRIKVVESGP